MSQPPTDIDLNVAPTVPVIRLVLEFNPATDQIGLAVPTGLDPMLTFQLLAQVTNAQIPGLCQEIVSLREQLKAHEGSAIIPISHLPAGLADANAPTNIRDFRRGNKS